MESLRRWLKKWDWTRISVWTIVILACVAFWAWVIDAGVRFFNN